MFGTLGWLIYTVLAIGLVVAIAVGLVWWIGIAFAAAFAALPAMAWLTKHRRR